MKKWSGVILLFILICNGVAWSQIEFKFNNEIEGKFYLLKMKGDRSIVVDTATVNDHSLFFPWRSEYQIGMYVLRNNEHSFPFIVDVKQIKVELNWPCAFDSAHFVKSVVNQNWQMYLQKRDYYYQHLNLLLNLINGYDKASMFFNEAVGEYERLCFEWLSYVDSIEKTNEGLLMDYVLADSRPIIPADLSTSAQGDFLKKHWFDGVNWNNELLVNSDILTTKISGYLQLYSNSRLSKSELEQHFIEAVDSFLPLASVNPVVFEFVLNYLIDGFKKYGFEEVIVHIALNHQPTENCAHEGDGAKSRLIDFERMRVGNFLPDAEITKLDGENIMLSELAGDTTVIVFWASWCVHCANQFNDWVAWYNKLGNTNLSAVFISLDNDSALLHQFLKSNNTPLPVYCDYKGWESAVAKTYNVYSTPTVIIIDRDLKVLEKPTSFLESVIIESK